MTVFNPSATPLMDFMDRLYLGAQHDLAGAAALELAALPSVEEVEEPQVEPSSAFLEQHPPVVCSVLFFFFFFGGSLAITPKERDRAAIKSNERILFCVWFSSTQMYMKKI
jgi:hypothetical protein